MCQEEELAASCGRGLKPGDRFDQEYDETFSSIIDHESSFIIIKRCHLKITQVVKSSW